MPTTYRIHPGIGIARLGNSPDAFCISPEQPAVLPLACDERGNPLLSPDGTEERRIETFKDAEGRVKRQAARFQVWAYDDESPQGRPLKVGDRIEGGGNAGVLVDIQWRVYLANKKASWYEFAQLDGEHGYGPGHARRNAALTDPEARQRLIIDPGPRSVDCTEENRRARFGRDGGDAYATAFPPPLRPEPIDSLGEVLTDDSGRLLVLGGHGRSGSYRFDEFGQPRIDDYANNDGWFDDTSDGPVMARLVMHSDLVDRTRFVDVEDPAWVIVGYPAYVPEILDVVTMDDVLQDLAVREFAERTDLYGIAGTFDHPQHVPPTDQEALVLWRAGRLQWNPEHRPWFYRDIWTILFRPDQYDYLCNVLGQSNYPHNQSTRGTFDPIKLGVPPRVDWTAVARGVTACMRRHHAGELFVETLAPALAVLEKPAHNVRFARAAAAEEAPLSERFAAALQDALSRYARALGGETPGEDYAAYLRRWREGADSAESAKAREELERAVEEALATASSSLPDDDGARLRSVTSEHLRKYRNGKLLEECRAKHIAASTQDLYGPMRQFLFDLLRQHGEENSFVVGDKPTSRVHNLPLMPLLAGDNPISNKLPAKFLRLTDYQYYLLRQWARGLFYNEELEGWGKPDPWHPYQGWVNRTGRDLDRGVLSNLLGGAFCPGGKAGWVMRNPSIYRVPYRIKADPGFYNFGQTAAQANANRGAVPERDYASYAGADLSQDNDFDTGLQPGDLTKSMALPWQADFNECSTQPIDVTYEGWNNIYPDSDHDGLMQRQQRVWETLWWPAHRPLQTFELVSVSGGKPNISWLDWTPGVPQTNAGDLKMVTEWWRLSFVRRNPWLRPGGDKPTAVPPPPNPPYISVERTKRDDGKEETP